MQAARPAAAGRVDAAAALVDAAAAAAAAAAAGSPGHRAAGGAEGGAEAWTSETPREASSNPRACIIEALLRLC